MSTFDRSSVDDRHIAALARNWWAVALRGVAAIVFGVLAFLTPGSALLALVLVFGAYAIVEGVLNIVAALRGRTGTPWWELMLEGIVSIAAGVIAFAIPGLTALVLLYLIAAWAVVTGVLEIVGAVRLRKHVTGEVWLALSGVLSIAFGVIVALAPAVGALAVVFWIGAYAVIFGAALIALGFRLRRWHRHDRVPLARAA